MSQATIPHQHDHQRRQAGTKGCGEMHSVITTLEVLMVAGTGCGIGMLAAMEAPDGVLYAACLAGSIGGAICSVRIKAAETQQALLNLVLSNVIFGMLAGPVGVQMVCHKTGWSPDFPLAVAVSGMMSGVVSLIAWIAIPALLQGAMKFDWFAAAASKIGLERKRAKGKSAPANEQG